jgi:hypothetical protein
MGVNSLSLMTMVLSAPPEEESALVAADKEEVFPPPWPYPPPPPPGDPPGVALPELEDPPPEDPREVLAPPPQLASAKARMRVRAASASVRFIVLRASFLRRLGQHRRLYGARRRIGSRRSSARLAGPIHPSAQRNCPKRSRRVHFEAYLLARVDTKIVHIRPLSSAYEAGFGYPQTFQTYSEVWLLLWQP